MAESEVVLLKSVVDAKSGSLFAGSQPRRRRPRRNEMERWCSSTVATATTRRTRQETTARRPRCTSRRRQGQGARWQDHGARAPRQDREEERHACRGHLEGDARGKSEPHLSDCQDGIVWRDSRGRTMWTHEKWKRSSCSVSEEVQKKQVKNEAEVEGS